MILTTAQLKDIIINNPNKDLVAKGREYSKRMRMHLYGEGIKEHLTKIDGMEADWLKTLRETYCKSNKDLFSRLSRPIDKVFSAGGGSVYYNLSESLNRYAMAAAMNVRDGYNVKKWIKNYWKPHFADDPCGIIFMEVGQNRSYPTYKSTSSIYDYLPKGIFLEYVVFNVSISEKKKIGLKPEDLVFRVVDDAFDYYVKRTGEEVTVLQDHTYPNYFMAVPAIINSDIINPNMDGSFLALFDDAIELAEQFLLFGSIHVTHKFRHGFPKYWEYGDTCGDCKGEGTVSGVKCEACKGTGKRIMLKVSDAKILEWPDKENPPVPTVAGYVSPDKDYHDMASSDALMFEQAMEYTTWGSQRSAPVQGPTDVTASGGQKTATQVIDDMQPMIDRLTEISEMAEKRHKFIIDHVIKINLQLINYPGASVIYGRRYLMESPDAIWDRYVQAKKNGASVSILDELFFDFIEAKYSGDPVAMNIQLKLKDVEPFVHFTINEVKGFNPSEEDYKAKLYFGEWLTLVTDAEILNSAATDLRTKLVTYSAAKTIVTPPPIPVH